MAQQNEEHFETIDKNKAEQYQRQKITYLEDRIKVLEKTLESHAKILARFQMTEGDKQMAIDDKLAFARFQSAMDNDDDYTFDSICRRYVNETKENKELINLTFIAICGYGLDTLLFNKDKSFMFNEQADTQKG